MQYLLVALDHEGEDVIERRESVRLKHLDFVENVLGVGEKCLYGAALLNENGDKVGSMEILEFDTRAELDERIKNDQFMVNNVWKDVMVYPCKVGPLFEHLYDK